MHIQIHISMFLIMILIIDIGIALTQRYSKQEDNYLDYSIILGIQKDELSVRVRVCVVAT